MSNAENNKRPCTLEANPGAATVSRYLVGDEIDQTDLKAEISEMARLFEPLLDRNWHAPKMADDLFRKTREDQANPEETSLEGSTEFAERLTHFLKTFEAKRAGAFAIDNELGQAA